jgi:hypothetical protein
LKTAPFSNGSLLKSKRQIGPTLRQLWTPAKKPGFIASAFVFGKGLGGLLENTKCNERQRQKCWPFFCPPLRFFDSQHLLLFFRCDFLRFGSGIFADCERPLGEGAGG